MKWALALALGAVAAVVVAFVLAVASTRDPVPELIRGCVVDGQAGIMRSPADLGAQPRSDIGAGAVSELTRTRVGDDTAVLLRGTNYRLLVLAGRKSPPLDGNLPLRVYERTPEFALVAKEVDPIEGVLRGCVASASGR
ncbi:MAG: hypothetical protein M3417_10165 [Actinomycetota bacterium]|nr:hypothetical protein [Actinomycetota bacterium]